MAMATACTTLPSASASAMAAFAAPSPPSSAKAAMEGAPGAMGASDHEPSSFLERGEAKQARFEFEANLQAALPGFSAPQEAAQPEKETGSLAYVCAFPGCSRAYRKSDGDLTLTLPLTLPLTVPLPLPLTLALPLPLPLTS